MKLHFSPEELNLLTEVLLNQGDPAGMLGRIKANDLRFDFDELDQLREILVANWTSASGEVAACHDRQARERVEARQAALESMIERVSETCATF